MNTIETAIEKLRERANAISDNTFAKRMQKGAYADAIVLLKEVLSEESKPAFKMPTDKQLIEIAILFNDRELDVKRLGSMVAMCQFVLDRLKENNDVTTPSSKEK